MVGPIVGPGDTSGASTLGDILIPIVNKLQDIFNQVTVDLKLDLPQVAVVGAQSSGKSSVLEALVGRDFLPRGNDIVTRRPLVLQLVKTQPSPVGSGRPNEWGEFLHAPGKIFSDFDRIRAEIQQETERLVGNNKNVSDKPIRLKIHSPHVLTMTLIDLPGLTRIPVGDQPTNIEQRIREMVLEYIRRPHCLVLAVTPANVDLATSDALQLAQVADPEGLRTIGVLTKIDLMDRGTDAAYILRNKHIPLRLGYVGVVLRSQHDINTQRPMAESRKAEDEFFHSHSEYCDISERCGTANLARILNHILVEHIKGLLPGLRRRIHDALDGRAAELRSLGEPFTDPGQSRSSRGAYLLQLLCDYAERYAAMLDGRHLDLTMTQQLAGGARVREVYTQQFVPSLFRLDPARDMSDSEVSNVIRNGAGVSGNLLVPQEPFELLARRAISQLLEPSLTCAERVHEVLLRIAEQACPQAVSRFPYLQRQLATTVLRFVRSGFQPATQMVRSLVDCEADYINTDHPDFIGGRGAMRSVWQDKAAAAARTGRKDGDAPGPSAGNSGKSGKEAASSKPGSGSAPSLGLKGFGDSPDLSDNMLLQPSGLGLANSRHRLESEPSSSDAAGTSNSNANGTNGNGHGSTFGSVAHVNEPKAGWFSWFSSGSSGTAAVAGAPGRDAGSPLGYTLRPGVGGEEGSILPLGHMHNASLRPKQGRTQAARLSDSELAEVEVVRRLVESYFDIVRKSVSDQVPKAIMHFMVNYTKRGLQQHLIRSLYRDELLDELLSEADGVVARRTALKEAVEVLRKAAAALDDLPAELSEQGTPRSPHATNSSTGDSASSSTGGSGGTAIQLSHMAGSYADSYSPQDSSSNGGPYAATGLPPFTYRPPTSPYKNMGSAADAGYGSSGGHALGAGAGASTAAANGKGPTPFALRSDDY